MSRGIKDGDVKKFRKGLKSFVVGHIILPQFYQFALNGFRWDDDDQKRMLLGNLTAIPMTGALLDWSANQIFNRPFGFSISPVESIPRYIQKSTESSQKLWEAISEAEKSLTFDEFWTLAWELMEAPAFVTGLPYGIEGSATGIKDVARGYTNNFKEDLQRVFGWSPWQVSPGKAVLDDYQKQVMYSIMNDENVAQMASRIIEQKGANHWDEHKGKYYKEYFLRQRFDPTYTDQLITDLYEARGNTDRQEKILLDIADKMPTAEFSYLVYNLSAKQRVRMSDKGEEAEREYNGVINDEVAWNVLKEVNKRKQEE
jgi:hypothetical protein